MAVIDGLVESYPKGCNTVNMSSVLLLPMKNMLFMDRDI